MTTLTIALDRSARRVDEDGRLHVERSHISKATVNPYYGSEIPGYEGLGLNPSKVYYLLRDPKELEAGAETFARLPILSEHVPVTVDAPRGDLVIGTIGSEVTFNSPYLDADLCFWDATAIAGIETDQIKELSCAYRYVPVMESGEFEGAAYDGRMTQIRGNHLALVEIGRAGPDVVVSDENPFIKHKELAMKMSKLGKVMFMALSAASPKLAADAALPALVGSANRKNFDRKDIKAKLLALDAELDGEQVDSVMDELLGEEKDENANPMAAENQTEQSESDSLLDKLHAMLDGKVEEELINKIVEMCSSASMAGDEDDKMDKDPGMKKEEVAAAMDSLKKELRAAEEARRDVREVVGDVFKIEAASDVYKFALDHMKVDRKDVEGTPALRALFKVAAQSKSVSPAPRIAQDADALVKQFPNASRFRMA
jgi:hypothetical protein